MKKIKSYNMLICIFVLIVITFIAIYNISKYSAEVLPKACEYTLNSETVTFNNLYSDGAENLKINGVGYAVPATIKDKKIKIIETDCNYPEIHNLCLNNGTFFNGDYENVCVISTNLAVHLFAKTNAVNETIKINESYYVIVGVYAPKQSFISQISSDGTEEVFIPANSSTILNKVFISENKDVPKTQNVHDYNLSVGCKLNENDIINWFEKSNLLLQYKNISIFIIGFSFGIISFIFGLICLKKIVLKNRLAKRLHRCIAVKELLGLLILAVTAFALTIIIFIMISFQPVIPSEWIPIDGNILNVFYYKDVIIQSFQIRNSFLMTYSDNVYWHSMWILFGYILLLLIECIVFLISIIKIFFKKSYYEGLHETKNNKENKIIF